MLFNHPLIIRADTFAKKAHGDIGQVRKYTGEPYINHPRAVARLVATVIDVPEIIAAALMHDVLEDTPIKRSYMLMKFGEVVTGYVDGLTDVSKPSDGNRAQRKALDLEHLAGAGFEIQSIKLCDLMHNTASIVKYDKDFARVYLPEKERLLAVLTKGHPQLISKAKQSLSAAKEQLHGKTIYNQ